MSVLEVGVAIDEQVGAACDDSSSEAPPPVVAELPAPLIL